MGQIQSKIIDKTFISDKYIINNIFKNSFMSKYLNTNLLTIFYIQ